MPDLGGRDLLREWQAAMEALLASAGSLAERSGDALGLTDPVRRQIELVQDLVERERRLQRELAGAVLGPFDAVFGLLEQSAATMRRQAEALQTAGRALDDAGGLMRSQAALFESTIETLRRPLQAARAAAAPEAPEPPAGAPPAG